MHSDCLCTCKPKFDSMDCRNDAISDQNLDDSSWKAANSIIICRRFSHNYVKGTA